MCTEQMQARIPIETGAKDLLHTTKHPQMYLSRSPLDGISAISKGNEPSSWAVLADTLLGP